MIIRLFRLRCVLSVETGGNPSPNNNNNNNNVTLGNWVRPTWGSCIAIYKVSPLLLLLGKKEEDKVAHSISMIAGRG
jgi:hypothetical protein